MANAGTVTVDFVGKDNLTPVMRRVDGQFNGLIKTAGGLAAAYVSLRKASQVIKDSVALYANFEQAVTNAGSVTGKFGAELAAAQKNVADISRQLGRETVFTATQAADAFYNLASAGVDVANVTKNDMRPILDLTAATQSDLVTTTETMVTTLRQFNLGMDQTNRVADVFVGAIGNSLARIERLDASLKFAGSSAEQFGVSLETTVATLSAFYNRGIDASTAGTAFRAMLSRLAKLTPDAQQALAKYGLTVKDVNVETNGLIPVLKTLGEANLSNADAITIFDQRYGPFVKAITESVGEIEELNDKLLETGGLSERVATQQLSTLQGSFKILKSQTEEVQLAIGEELAPTLQDFNVTLGDNLNGIQDVGIGIANVLIPAIEGLGAILPGINKTLEVTGKSLAFIGVALDSVPTLLQGAANQVNTEIANRGVFGENFDYRANILDPRIQTINPQLDFLEKQRIKNLEELSSFQERVEKAANGVFESITKWDSALGDTGETGSEAMRHLKKGIDDAGVSVEDLMKEIEEGGDGASDALKELEKRMKAYGEAAADVDRDRAQNLERTLLLQKAQGTLTEREERLLKRVQIASSDAFDIQNARTFDDLLESMNRYTDNLSKSFEDAARNISKAKDALKDMGDAANDRILSIGEDIATAQEEAQKDLVAEILKLQKEERDLSAKTDAGTASLEDIQRLDQVRVILNENRKTVEQYNAELRKLEQFEALDPLQKIQQTLAEKEKQLNLSKQLEEAFLQDLEQQRADAEFSFKEGALQAFVDTNRDALTAQQIRHADELIGESEQQRSILKLNTDTQQDITDAITTQIGIRNDALEAFKNDEVTRLNAIRQAALDAASAYQSLSSQSATGTGHTFAGGGYTGNGPTGAIAGTVGRREYVIPSDVLPGANRLGITAILEAMRRGGFSTGGSNVTKNNSVTNHIQMRENLDLSSFLERMRFQLSSA